LPARGDVGVIGPRGEFFRLSCANWVETTTICAFSQNNTTRRAPQECRGGKDGGDPTEPPKGKLKRRGDVMERGLETGAGISSLITVLT